jgi:hypothetical protein
LEHMGWAPANNRAALANTMKRRTGLLTLARI